MVNNIVDTSIFSCVNIKERRISMCRVGDIIVVKEFKDKNGIVVPRHSFV